MKKQTNGPSVIEDLSALGGLYLRVFWMMGRRLRRPSERRHDPALVEPQFVSKPNLRVVRLHRHA